MDTTVLTASLVNIRIVNTGEKDFNNGGNLVSKICYWFTYMYIENTGQD